MPINYKGSIIPMLDSIKNSLFGRVHYPHTHLIETGAHAITLVTHGGSSSEIKSQSRERDFIWILEKLVRINDQLDEQLHAGYYFYILTSPSRFVSNSVFIWPFVCLYAGLILPIWLENTTNEERIKKSNIKSQANFYSKVFMVLTYLICALISQIPSWYLSRSQVGQKICLANENYIKALRNDIVQYTLQFALVSSIVVLLNFKMFI